ncbi:MAG: hypothetical protein ABIJ34_07890 [archaeon]
MECVIKEFCNGYIWKISISDSLLNFLAVLALLIYIGAFSYLLYKKKNKIIKHLAITTIAVILFEIMIDPLVQNNRLPGWSYFYHDSSFLITFGWVFIVAGAIWIVDFAFGKSKELTKFFLYLCAVDAIALPIEILLVLTKVRVYSPSLVASSVGVSIPFTGIPLEVAFAIPLYFALVIGFTKYWERQ